jgi:protein phosphatase
MTLQVRDIDRTTAYRQPTGGSAMAPVGRGILRPTGSQSRPSTAVGKVSSGVVLELEDGRAIPLQGHGFIGRQPAPPAGATAGQVVAISDLTSSLSRTHLEFDVADTGMWVRDCYSTNGSTVELPGQRSRLKPGVAARLAGSCVLRLGDRRVRVRMATERAVGGPATVRFGAASQAGASRRHNEDSSCTTFPVFAVADGMGGHGGGELASSAVVEALGTLAGQTRLAPDAVTACLTDARSRIAAIPESEDKAPGSTLSGVVVTQDDDGRPCWMVANIGDSRTYRLDGSGLTLLTEDHTVVSALVSRGAIRPEKARDFMLRNVLTRAIQAHTDDLPDVQRVPMRHGDRILVCSDGVTGVLDDVAIGHVLRTVGDPQAAADELIRAVVAAGGSDDATAVVVDSVAR